MLTDEGGLEEVITALLTDDRQRAESILAEILMNVQEACTGGYEGFRDIAEGSIDVAKEMVREANA